VGGSDGRIRSNEGEEEEFERVGDEDAEEEMNDDMEVDLVNGGSADFGSSSAGKDDAAGGSAVNGGVKRKLEEDEDYD
jgi:hypothetical protein